ncbi:MAG: hypothetical protein CL677_02910 [Bdellovibrionaceae bacterium]|nr:hypothetical protein [Pseudobdellovibrionaceae bacterium]
MYRSCTNLISVQARSEREDGPSIAIYSIVKSVLALFILSFLVIDAASAQAAPISCSALFGKKTIESRNSTSSKPQRKSWEKLSPEKAQQAFLKMTDQMATAIEMNGVFEHPERLFERVFIEGQKFKGDTTKDFMILDQNLKSIANHTIDSRVLLPHEALRLLKFGQYLDEQIKNIQVSSGDIPMIPGPWILRAEQAPTIEVPHRHQRNPFYQNRIAFSLVKSEMGAGSILRDQETPEGTLLMLTEGGRNGFFNRFELNPVTGRMEGPQHGSGWDGKNRLLLLRQYYYP